MSLEKKVIILDKLNSPTIAQAIFILKDSCVSEFSALDEAERIVDEYMAGEFFHKRSHLPLFLTLGALSFALFIVFLIL